MLLRPSTISVAFLLRYSMTPPSPWGNTSAAVASFSCVSCLCHLWPLMPSLTLATYSTPIVCLSTIVRSHHVFQPNRVEEAPDLRSRRKPPPPGMSLSTSCLLHRHLAPSFLRTKTRWQTNPRRHHFSSLYCFPVAVRWRR